MEPKWLEWVKALQAVAQNGLTFAKDPYDVERYEAIRGIAAEIGACYTEIAPEKLVGLFERETGYATPKVDSRAAVFQGDGILLVRETSDGKWTLPGGWVDVGDAPSEAVEREVREESGYLVKARKLVAVLDRNKHNPPPSPLSIYKLFFLCELIGGEPTESIETDAVGFFRLSNLPELSTGRTTVAQIARLFEHRDHPEWPADFD